MDDVVCCAITKMRMGIMTMKVKEVKNGLFHVEFYTDKGLWDIERELVAAFLAAHNNNRTRTAKTLRMGLRTLQRWMNDRAETK